MIDAKNLLYCRFGHLDVILGEADRIVAEFNDHRKAAEFFNKHMAHPIWTEDETP